MKKPLTTNPMSCKENGLKLTYSNVEFQTFLGENPGALITGAGKGGEGKGGRKERGEKEKT